MRPSDIIQKLIKKKAQEYNFKDGEVIPLSIVVESIIDLLDEQHDKKTDQK